VKGLIYQCKERVTPESAGEGAHMKMLETDDNKKVVRKLRENSCYSGASFRLAKWVFLFRSAFRPFGSTNTDDGRTDNGRKT